MPGRVKGANSDYAYDAGKISEANAEEKARSLYLEVFVCPGEQPSRVEENTGQYCEGLTSTCPSQTPGHARVYLSREDGASLATDKASIEADQAGFIRLEGAGGVTILIGKTKLLVDANHVAVEGDLQISGNLNVAGDLTVGGSISGDGALTPEYKELLDKLAAGDK